MQPLFFETCKNCDGNGFTHKTTVDKDESECPEFPFSDGWSPSHIIKHRCKICEGTGRFNYEHQLPYMSRSEACESVAMFASFLAKQCKINKIGNDMYNRIVVHLKYLY